MIGEVLHDMHRSDPSRRQQGKHAEVYKRLDRRQLLAGLAPDIRLKKNRLDELTNQGADQACARLIKQHRCCRDPR